MKKEARSSWNRTIDQVRGRPANRLAVCLLGEGVGLAPALSPFCLPARCDVGGELQAVECGCIRGPGGGVVSQFCISARHDWDLLAENLEEQVRSSL